MFKKFKKKPFLTVGILEQINESMVGNSFGMTNVSERSAKIRIKQKQINYPSRLINSPKQNSTANIHNFNIFSPLKRHKFDQEFKIFTKTKTKVFKSERELVEWRTSTKMFLMWVKKTFPLSPCVQAKS